MKEPCLGCPILPLILQHFLRQLPKRPAFLYIAVHIAHLGIKSTFKQTAYRRSILLFRILPIQEAHIRSPIDKNCISGGIGKLYILIISNILRIEKFLFTINNGKYMEILFSCNFFLLDSTALSFGQCYYE